MTLHCSTSHPFGIETHRVYKPTQFQVIHWIFDLQPKPPNGHLGRQVCRRLGRDGLPVNDCPCSPSTPIRITCAKPVDVEGLLTHTSLPGGTLLEVSCSYWTSFAWGLPSPPTPIQKVLAPITVVMFQAALTEIHAIGGNSLFSFRCPQPIFFLGPNFTLFRPRWSANSTQVLRHRPSLPRSWPRYLPSYQRWKLSPLRMSLTRLAGFLTHWWGSHRCAHLSKQRPSPIGYLLRKR